MISSRLLTRFNQCWIRSISTSLTANQNLVKCEFVNDKAVAVIKLNDPAKLNPLSRTMGAELMDLVKQLNSNDSIRAIILTGEGKAFSSGGNLDWLLERGDQKSESSNEQTMVDFYGRFLVLRQTKVPVIGVINGAAIGAGLCLALGGCDIRYAQVKAKMGMTFVKLGLHPGMAGTHFLPRLTSPSIAAELLLTGRLISGKEAEDFGLVNKASEDPMEDALSLCQEISHAAPIAVRECLQTLRQSQEVPRSLQQSMHREAEAQAITYKTSDLREGVQALKEKRRPKFQGK